MIWMFSEECSLLNPSAGGAGGRVDRSGVRQNWDLMRRVYTRLDPIASKNGENARKTDDFSGKQPLYNDKNSRTGF